MDIIKRYTYFDIGDIPITKTQYSTSSRNWVQWSCIVTRNTCSYCAGLQGHILSPNDSTIVWPPVHPNRRCQVIPVIAFPAGTATEDGKNGIDHFIFVYGFLPEYHISQNEAYLRGWRPWKGNLDQIAPGAVIGGDIYENRDGRLPDSLGRIWYEADFDYSGGYRNKRRIVFSNDGLMFVTYDHYLTFSEIYWEDDYDDLYHRP